MRRTVLLALLSASIFVLPGCVGPEVVATAGWTAAQAGVSEFSKGRLETAWELPIGVMFRASREALVDLGYRIDGTDDQGEEWFVAARELDDAAIEVYLTRSSERVTRVTIRVGMFGNQPLSRLVSDAIGRKIRSWEPIVPVPFAPPDAPPGTPTAPAAPPR